MPQIPVVIPPAGEILVPIDTPAFTTGPLVDRPGVSLASGDGSRATDGSDVFTLESVERPVVAIPGTSPRYPDLLRQAGVEGRVTVRFVVDTMGVVERGSVVPVQSDHPLFALAVRDALSRARFVPAEADGHRVRQLVEQSFTFSISRR
jgi:protein TonB